MNFKANKFQILVVFILIIKIFLLLWSAHPFDFWTFVNTVQRHAVYGWNLFEYWNKGNLLLLSWYSLYALLLTIFQCFPSLIQYNVLFLHFFFKIPFLLADITIAALLFKIAQKVSSNKKTAQNTVLLWLLNPLSVYSYVIHGHYEILTALSLVLMVYGLIFDSWIAIAISFIFGIQLRYFFFIFLPFVYFFLLMKGRRIQILYTSLLIGVGLFLSYLQFLFLPGLLQQNLGSIFDLASTNAPLGVTSLRLPPINIFSAANWFIRPLSPISNLLNPQLFEIAQKGLFFIAAILIIHFLYRFYKSLSTKSYSLEQCIRDLFICILYFPLFLANYQEHYLIWAVPMYLTILAFTQDKKLLYLFSAYTVIGFLFAFRGEFGTITYFLDVINPINLISLTSKYDLVTYREGMFIVVTVLLSILYLSKFKKNSDYLVKKFDFYIHYVLLSVLWLLMLMPYVQVLYEYAIETNHYETLAYTRPSLNRGAINVDYSPEKILSGTIIWKNESASGSLFLNVFQTLDVEMRKYFIASILLPLPVDTTNLTVTLNDCSAGNAKITKDFVDGQLYQSIDFDSKCLNLKNNVSVLKPKEDKYTFLSGARLYVHNVETPFIYDPNLKEEIISMSLLAIILLITFFVGLYRLLRK